MAGRGRTRKWHRWLGFALAGPLVFVSVTGILLNHVDGLGWNSRMADGEWILGHYGMGLSGDPVSFVSGQQTFSSWGGVIVLNSSPTEAEGDLVGVMETDEGTAATCGEVIHLFDNSGALLESLDSSSLPEGRISKVGAPRVLSMEDGSRWGFSPDFLEFSRYEGSEPDWSEPVSTSASVRQSLASDYRGQGLPWSRVLLDLHSGKFFGPTGRVIADGVVILMVVLSLTGLRLGLRKRKEKSESTLK